MENFKSHFTFSKKQRNGIFLLVLIIVGLQAVYFFVSFSSEDVQVNQDELQAFQKEIDSLRLVEIEKRKPKIYPFNPNYITDYKGYTLGMTNEEIDRLLAFRKQDKWVNSAKEFQDVTQVSDSFLSKISPYFKFPEWVTNPKPKKEYAYKNNNQPKTYTQKQDLNTASATQLQKVNGIGEAYSKRIVAYREKYGGFIADVQLQEIYGLSPEVIERLTEQFTVKTPKEVDKISLNSATIEELVTIQYIDYEIAHHIIEQRTLRDGYQSLDDLLKVKSFPSNKIDIIKLYLKLN
ncbi:helix-hairpin-helix domain-containing protein [Xanthomarina sp. F1114]|uniref:ComEA family DNA-binding protein n=1 Tax=Xanthomarina sp. F1114 TaxID=2996019 RepID=UPI00225E5B58|nr:helix-hairpin-helix domain-containing protein [Xanthomarina sp. F1114]MCX7548155.1 helix-hairpin-helix domain-containing protein [Xanthomarina sp. F1114]